MLHEKTQCEGGQRKAALAKYIGLALQAPYQCSVRKKKKRRGQIKKLNFFLSFPAEQTAEDFVVTKGGYE